MISARSMISCTARATPSKRTWKSSLAEARPRWAPQRAFATRFCKPRRCSIAGVGSKLSRTGLNRPRTRADSLRGYQHESAGCWGHHPFLRAANSFGLPPTGPSQPQSPDRGLAGTASKRACTEQGSSHMVCRTSKLGDDL
jgi:hypothetical protein